METEPKYSGQWRRYFALTEQIMSKQIEITELKQDRQLVLQEIGFPNEVSSI